MFQEILFSLLGKEFAVFFKSKYDWLGSNFKYATSSSAACRLFQVAAEGTLCLLHHSNLGRLERSPLAWAGSSLCPLTEPNTLIWTELGPLSLLSGSRAGSRSIRLNSPSQNTGTSTWVHLNGKIRQVRASATCVKRALCFETRIIFFSSNTHSKRKIILSMSRTVNKFRMFSSWKDL